MEAGALALEELADRGLRARAAPAARRARRRRRAGPPRPPAPRPSRGGRAASRRSPRRAPARRRCPRRRRRCGRSFRTSAGVYAPSTRRISASAAIPTSSCSGVGSFVARRRWISRPGAVEGLGERGAVVAIAPGEHLDRQRGAAEADPGAGHRPGALDQPLEQHGAAGREQHHRGDEVRAAAVVLLGDAGRVLDPLLVGGDRLVLDPVVGGQVAIGEGDHRRAPRRSPAPAPRAAPRRGGACAAASSPPGWRRSPPRPAGPRREAAPTGSRRRTRGSTAIASASFSGPRSPGSRAASFGASSGLRSEATSISPDGSRTAAAQWVGPWIRRPLRSAIPPSRSFSSAIDPTIDDRIRREWRAQRSVAALRAATEFPPDSLLDPAGGPQSRPPAGVRLSLALAWKAALETLATCRSCAEVNFCRSRFLSGLEPAAQLLLEAAVGGRVEAAPLEARGSSGWSLTAPGSSCA